MNDREQIAWLTQQLNTYHDRQYRWTRFPLWRRLWTVLTRRIPY